MSSAVIFQVQSILVYSLLLFGISKRRQKDLHAKTMLAVIVWDILLILQIELSRNAVAKAAKAMVNPVILNIHVAFALSCVILYVFQLISGRKLIKADYSLRRRHMYLGWATLVLRTLTLITSFWAVIPKGN